MIIRSESINNFALRWAGVAVFLIFWEAAPRLDWIDPYFLPPFSAVVAEIGRLFRDGQLGIHLLVSVWRALTGLLSALLVGLPLGFLLGRWLTGMAEALQPVLAVLSQVNPFSLMPVFVLFFGIGELAKIAVVGWVSIWPIIFYTITATRNIDPLQVRTAASMGISRKDMFLKVILPASLPTIFVGIRVSAGLTFFILIAAEMLGASAGLGFLVHNSAMNYQIPRIYAGATFIVLFGFLLNRSLLHVERHLFACRERAEFLFCPDKRNSSVWRPGQKKVVATIAALLVFILVFFGGLEVRRIDKGAASFSAQDEKHSRHLGQPVNDE